MAQSRVLRERNREIRAELRSTLAEVQKTMDRAVAICSGVAPAPNNRLSKLTDRERRAMILMVSGHSTKQVDAVLGIAFKTAITHRTHIMEKLNIHEATGLTRLAIVEDWFELDTYLAANQRRSNAGCIDQGLGASGVFDQKG